VPNRPTRPGLTHLTCAVLAALLALFGIIAAITLTAVDSEHRQFPNTVVTGADVLAGTAITAMVALIASWWAQARVLTPLTAVETRVEDILNEVRRLREDTARIPQLAAATIEAPEIVIIKVPEQHFEAVDRDRANRVLAEAEQRMAEEEVDVVPLPTGMAAQIWDMSARATERRLNAADGDSR
jgi:hypothetical protein